MKQIEIQSIEVKLWRPTKLKRGRKEIYPLTVRQKILEGARKWMGPWDGFVFILLRRKRRYFIFCLTSPPESAISSQRTTTTRWPLRSSLATMDARRPNMWWRASTTTLFAMIPDPETIFRVSLFSLSRRKKVWSAPLLKRNEGTFRV